MRNFVLIITLASISITIFAGNCQCPYDKDNAGNLCGKRSAWCKLGGESPECDSSKITDQLKEECRYGKNVTTFPDPGSKQISETDYLAHIGSCPCPYNIDKAGNLFGKHSAWCRPGGYSPICNLTRISYDTIEECKYNK